MKEQKTTYFYSIKNKVWFRAIAVSLIIAFLNQDIVWAQGGSPIWLEHKPDSGVPHKQEAVKDINGISIPKDIAVTKDASTTQGNGNVIINIQDAHASLSAQESIVKILDNLITNYDLNLIAIEGSSGYIDTSLLKTFPNKSIRDQTAQGLMAKGRMSAGEFFTITNDKDVALYGIDDKDLYKANLEQFRQLYELNNELRPDIDALKAEIKQLESKSYPKEALELDKYSSLINDSKAPFQDRWTYINKLALRYSIDYASYENISKLGKAIELEKFISFERANKERDALIDSLTKRLAKDRLEELVLKSLAFKSNKISQAEFYTYLQTQAKKEYLDPKDYPNLIEYTNYITLYESIDLIAVFDELKHFEDRIKNKLLTTKEQKDLYRLSRTIGLVSDLFEAKLVNSDFEELQGLLKEYTEAEIASSAFGVLAMTTSVIASDCNGVAPKQERSNPNNLTKILDAIPAAVEFYKTAEARNRGMLNNTIKRMNDEGKHVAALITGGYHTKGLTQLLNENKTSYLVILPKFDKDSKERPYVAILTSKKEPYKDLLESGDYYIATSAYFETGDLKQYKSEFVRALRLASKGQGPEKAKELIRLWYENYEAFYKAFNAKKAPKDFTPIPPERVEAYLDSLLPLTLSSFHDRRADLSLPYGSLGEGNRNIGIHTLISRLEAEEGLNEENFDEKFNLNLRRLGMEDSNSRMRKIAKQKMGTGYFFRNSDGRKSSLSPFRVVASGKGQSPAKGTVPEEARASLSGLDIKVEEIREKYQGLKIGVIDAASPKEGYYPELGESLGRVLRGYIRDRGFILTGGASGVGVDVYRGIAKEAGAQDDRFFMILPESAEPDEGYKKVSRAKELRIERLGNDMSERRIGVGEVADLIIVLNGGKGALREAISALESGKKVIALDHGGAGALLYHAKSQKILSKGLLNAGLKREHTANIILAEIDNIGITLDEAFGPGPFKVGDIVEDKVSGKRGIVYGVPLRQKEERGQLEPVVIVKFGQGPEAEKILPKGEAKDTLRILPPKGSALRDAHQGRRESTNGDAAPEDFDKDRFAKLVETINTANEKLAEYPEAMRPKNSAGRPGALVKIEDGKALLHIADLHGNLKNLETILQRSNADSRLKEGGLHIVFTGDIIFPNYPSPNTQDVSRETTLKCLQTLSRALELKAAFPLNVHILPGNHEDSVPAKQAVARGSIYPEAIFRLDLIDLFGKEADEFLFGKIDSANEIGRLGMFIANSPIGVKAQAKNGWIFLTHGGVSKKVNEQIKDEKGFVDINVTPARDKKNNPALYDLLWQRCAVDGIIAEGEEGETNRFLDNVGSKFLITAHSPMEAFPMKNKLFMEPEQGTNIFAVVGRQIIADAQFSAFGWLDIGLNQDLPDEPRQLKDENGESAFKVPGFESEEARCQTYLQETIENIRTLEAQAPEAAVHFRLEFMKTCLTDREILTRYNTIADAYGKGRYKGIPLTRLKPSEISEFFGNIATPYIGYLEIYMERLKTKDEKAVTELLPIAINVYVMIAVFSGDKKKLEEAEAVRAAIKEEAAKAAQLRESKGGIKSEEPAPADENGWKAYKAMSRRIWFTPQDKAVQGQFFGGQSVYNIARSVFTIIVVCGSFAAGFYYQMPYSVTGVPFSSAITGFTFAILATTFGGAIAYFMVGHVVAAAIGVAAQILITILFPIVRMLSVTYPFTAPSDTMGYDEGERPPSIAAASPKSAIIGFAVFSNLAELSVLALLARLYLTGITKGMPSRLSFFIPLALGVASLLFLFQYLDLKGRLNWYYRFSSWAWGGEPSIKPRLVQFMHYVCDKAAIARGGGISTVLPIVLPILVFLMGLVGLGSLYDQISWSFIAEFPIFILGTAVSSFLVFAAPAGAISVVGLFVGIGRSILGKRPPRISQPAGASVKEETPAPIEAERPGPAEGPAPEARPISEPKPEPAPKESEARQALISARELIHIAANKLGRPGMSVPEGQTKPAITAVNELLRKRKMFDAEMLGRLILGLALAAIGLMGPDIYPAHVLTGWFSALGFNIPVLGEIFPFLNIETSPTGGVQATFILLGLASIAFAAANAVKTYISQESSKKKRLEEAIGLLKRGVDEVDRLLKVAPADAASASILKNLREGIPIPAANIYAQPNIKEPLMGSVESVTLQDLAASARRQLEQLENGELGLSERQKYELLRIGRAGPRGFLHRAFLRLTGRPPYNGIELEASKLYRTLKAAEVIALEADIEASRGISASAEDINRVIDATKKKHRASLEETIRLNEVLRAKGSSAYQYPLVTLWAMNIMLVFAPFFLIYIFAPYAIAYLDIHSAGPGFLNAFFLSFARFYSNHVWIAPLFLNGLLALSIVNWIYKDFYVSPAGLFSGRETLYTKGKKVSARRGVVRTDQSEIKEFFFLEGREQFINKFITDHTKEVNQLQAPNSRDAGAISADGFLDLLLSDVNLYKIGSLANAPPRILVDEFFRHPEISEKFPIYTVVLPAFGEPAVIEDLIESVGNLIYPPDKLDVILLPETSDTDSRKGEKVSTLDLIHSKLTREPAKYRNFTALTSPIRLAPEHNQSKPYSTNYALAITKGEYLVIYDAEDRPYPLQLIQAVMGFDSRDAWLSKLIEYMSRKTRSEKFSLKELRDDDIQLYRKTLEYRFDIKELSGLIAKAGRIGQAEEASVQKAAEAYSKKHPLGVLQVPLTWYNPTTLTASQFILDYAVWFDIFLPGLEAKKLPVSHGGTSNHFIVKVLREVGGWDPHNVTEDAQIAGDIQRAGYESLMLDSITAEEAPTRQVRPEKWDWVRQHSRWGKGFLQVFFVFLRNLLLRPAEMRKAFGLRGIVSVFFLFGIGTFSYLFYSLSIVTSVLWGASNLIVLGPAWSIGVMTAAALAVSVMRGEKLTTFLKWSAAIVGLNLLFGGLVASFANYYLMMVPHALPIIPWLTGLSRYILPAFALGAAASVLYVFICKPGPNFFRDALEKGMESGGFLAFYFKMKAAFILVLSAGIGAICLVGGAVHPYFTGLGLIMLPIFTSVFYNLASVYLTPPYRDFALEVTINELSIRQAELAKKGQQEEAARLKELVEKLRQDPGFYNRLLYISALLMPVYRTFSVISFWIGYGQLLAGMAYYWDKTEHFGRASLETTKRGIGRVNSLFRGIRHRFTRMPFTKRPKFLRIELAAVCFAALVLIPTFFAPIRYFVQFMKKEAPDYNVHEIASGEGAGMAGRGMEYYDYLVSAYRENPYFIRDYLKFILAREAKGSFQYGDEKRAKLCVMAYLDTILGRVKSDGERERIVSGFIGEIRSAITDAEAPPVQRENALRKKLDAITGKGANLPSAVPAWLSSFLEGGARHALSEIEGWRNELSQTDASRQSKSGRGLSQKGGVPEESHVSASGTSVYMSRSLRVDVSGQQPVLSFPGLDLGVFARRFIGVTGENSNDPQNNYEEKHPTQQNIYAHLYSLFSMVAIMYALMHNISPNIKTLSLNRANDWLITIAANTILPNSYKAVANPFLWLSVSLIITVFIAYREKGVKPIFAKPQGRLTVSGSGGGIDSSSGKESQPRLRDNPTISNQVRNGEETQEEPPTVESRESTNGQIQESPLQDVSTTVIAKGESFRLGDEVEFKTDPGEPKRVGRVSEFYEHYGLMKVEVCEEGERVDTIIRYAGNLRRLAAKVYRRPKAGTYNSNSLKIQVESLSRKIVKTYLAPLIKRFEGEKNSDEKLHNILIFYLKFFNITVPDNYLKYEAVRALDGSGKEYFTSGLVAAVKRRVEATRGLSKMFKSSSSFEAPLIILINLTAAIVMLNAMASSEWSSRGLGEVPKAVFALDVIAGIAGYIFFDSIKKALHIDVGPRVKDPEGVPDSEQVYVLLEQERLHRSIKEQIALLFALPPNEIIENAIKELQRAEEEDDPYVSLSLAYDALDKLPQDQKIAEIRAAINRIASRFAELHVKSPKKIGWLRRLAGNIANLGRFIHKRNQFDPKVLTEAIKALEKRVPPSGEVGKEESKGPSLSSETPAEGEIEPPEDTERASSSGTAQAPPDFNKLIETIKAANGSLEKYPDAMRPKNSVGKPGALVKIGSGTSLIHISDIHGRFDNLKKILRDGNVEKRLRDGELHVVFTGDVLHAGPPRGLNSLKVLRYLSGKGNLDCLKALLIALELKARFPLQVHFIPGNHENAHAGGDSVARSVGLLNISQHRAFIEYLVRTYERKKTIRLIKGLRDFVADSPLGIKVRAKNGNIFLVHAGVDGYLNKKIKTEGDFTDINVNDGRKKENNPVLYTLLWTRDAWHRPKKAAENTRIFLNKMDSAVLLTGHTPIQYFPRHNRKFHDKSRDDKFAIVGRQIIVYSNEDEFGWLDIGLNRDLPHYPQALKDADGESAFKVSGASGRSHLGRASRGGVKIDTECRIGELEKEIEEGLKEKNLTETSKATKDKIKTVEIDGLLLDIFDNRSRMAYEAAERKRLGDVKPPHPHPNICKFCHLGNNEMIMIGGFRILHINGVPYEVPYNPNPYFPDHILLNAGSEEPQFLSRDKIMNLLTFQRALGPAFGGHYNGVDAGATIHHFHGQFRRWQTPLWRNLKEGRIALVDTKVENEVTVSRLKKWPADLRIFESKNIEALADRIWQEVDLLLQHNIPHNLEWMMEPDGTIRVALDIVNTTEFKNVNPEKPHEIIYGAVLKSGYIPLTYDSVIDRFNDLKTRDSFLRAVLRDLKATTLAYEDVQAKTSPATKALMDRSAGTPASTSEKGLSPKGTVPVTSRASKNGDEIRDKILRKMGVARTLQKSGKLEEAKTVLNEALALDPNDQKTKTTLAKVEIGLKNYSAAVEILSDVNDAIGLMVRAMAKNYQGDSGGAIKDLRQILAQDPADIPARDYLARIYYGLEKYDDAICEADEGLKHKPGNEGFITIKAMALVDKARDENMIASCVEAEKLIRGILKPEEDDVRLLNLLARALIHQGYDRERYDEALKILRRARDIEPMNLSTALLMVHLFHEMGRQEASDPNKYSSEINDCIKGIMARPAAEWRQAGPHDLKNYVKLLHDLGRYTEACSFIEDIRGYVGSFPRDKDGSRLLNHLLKHLEETLPTGRTSRGGDSKWDISHIESLLAKKMDGQSKDFETHLNRLLGIFRVAETAVTARGIDPKEWFEGNAERLVGSYLKLKDKFGTLEKEEKKEGRCAFYLESLKDGKTTSERAKHFEDSEVHPDVEKAPESSVVKRDCRDIREDPHIRVLNEEFGLSEIKVEDRFALFKIGIHRHDWRIEALHDYYLVVPEGLASFIEFYLLLGQDAGKTIFGYDRREIINAEVRRGIRILGEEGPGGAKEKGLVRLKKMGLPVPPGIVLSAELVEKILNSEGTKLEDYLKAIIGELEKLGIKEGDDEGYAVRSNQPDTLPGGLMTVFRTAFSYEGGSVFQHPLLNAIREAAPYKAEAVGELRGIPDGKQDIIIQKWAHSKGKNGFYAMGAVSNYDLNTGKRGFHGNYEEDIEGKDFMNGVLPGKDIGNMKNRKDGRKVYDELEAAVERIAAEGEGGEAFEIEFVVSKGKLWFIQLRLAQFTLQGEIVFWKAQREEGKVGEARFLAKMGDIQERLERMGGRPIYKAKEGAAPKVLFRGIKATSGAMAGPWFICDDEGLAMADKERKRGGAVLFYIQGRPDLKSLASLFGKFSRLGLMLPSADEYSHPVNQARWAGVPAIGGLDAHSFEGRALVIGGHTLEEGISLVLDADGKRVLDVPEGGSPEGLIELDNVLKDAACGINVPEFCRGLEKEFEGQFPSLDQAAYDELLRLNGEADRAYQELTKIADKSNLPADKKAAREADLRKNFLHTKLKEVGGQLGKERDQIARDHAAAVNSSSGEGRVAKSGTRGASGGTRDVSKSVINEAENFLLGDELKFKTKPGESSSGRVQKNHPSGINEYVYGSGVGPEETTPTGLRRRLGMLLTGITSYSSLLSGVTMMAMMNITPMIIAAAILPNLPSLTKNITSASQPAADIWPRAIKILATFSLLPLVKNPFIALSSIMAGNSVVKDINVIDQAIPFSDIRCAAETKPLTLPSPHDRRADLSLPYRSLGEGKGEGELPADRGARSGTRDASGGAMTWSELLRKKTLEPVDGVFLDLHGVMMDIESGKMVSLPAICRLLVAHGVNVFVVTGAAGFYLAEFFGIDQVLLRFILASKKAQFGKLSEAGARAGILSGEGIFKAIEGFEEKSFRNEAGANLLISMMRGILEKFGLDSNSVDARVSSITAESKGYEEGRKKRLKVARDVVRSLKILKSMYAPGIISPGVNVVVSASAVDIVAADIKEAILQVVKLLGLKRVIIVGDSVGTPGLPGDDREALKLKGEKKITADNGLAWRAVFTPVYVGREAAKHVPKGSIIAPKGKRGVDATDELIAAIDEAKAHKAEQQPRGAKGLTRNASNRTRDASGGNAAAELKLTLPEGATPSEIKDEIYRTAISILKRMYPEADGEVFETFIREFESEDRVPAGPKRRLLIRVEASNSMRHYLVEITDAYNLLRIHRDDKPDGKDKAHIYIYNPQSIGGLASTRIMVAAQERTGLLVEISDFVSNGLLKIRGRPLNIESHWSTVHDGGKTTILCFDVLDNDTKAALNDEEIKKIYDHLNQGQTGTTGGARLVSVEQKSLREPADRVMAQMLGLGDISAMKKEYVLHGLKTGGARIAEGYAYILPTIQSSILDEKICLPWDSDRSVMLKIAAAIYDLEKASQSVAEKLDKTAAVTLRSICTMDVSAVFGALTALIYPNEREALIELVIMIKEIARQTIHAGRDARRIDDLLKERIDKKVKEYNENIDHSMPQKYMLEKAAVLRKMGDGLMAEFHKKREEISGEELESELKKLREVLGRVKERIRRALVRRGEKEEEEIGKFEKVLDAAGEQAEERMKERHISPAAALLEVIKEYESRISAQGLKGRFVTTAREIVANIMQGISILDTRKGFGESMKAELVEMEKAVLRTVITDVSGSDASKKQEEGESLYSSEFIELVRTRVPQEIEKGKGAAQAVVDIMDEVLSQNGRDDADRSRVEAAASAIVERLESIKLLDDTHDLMKNELPLIVITDSLDIYRALRLFEESPQIAGIITAAGEANDHGAIVASAQVPTLTSAKSDDGKSVAELVKTGDKVIIDEKDSTIYVNPGFDTEDKIDLKKAEAVILQHEAETRKSEPLQAGGHGEVRFAIDMTDPREFKEAFSYGFGDVGLLRSEMLYQGGVPSENTLADIFIKIADAAGGRVAIRMFDMQPDKKPAYMAGSDLRGTAYLLSEEGLKIAKPLVRAIIKAHHASKNKNIDILFPMVEDAAQARSVSDFTHKIIGEIRSEQGISGDEARFMRIGGMIESLKAVDNREAIMPVFDFISIGTNDLVDSMRLPAKADILISLMRCISSVLETTSSMGKDLSLCGEWPAYVTTALAMLAAAKRHKGKITLTVRADRAARLKQIARNADVKEIEDKTAPFISTSDGAGLNDCLNRLAAETVHRATINAFNNMLKEERNTGLFRRAEPDIAFTPSAVRASTSGAKEPLSLLSPHDRRADLSLPYRLETINAALKSVIEDFIQQQSPTLSEAIGTDDKESDRGSTSGAKNEIDIEIPALAHSPDEVARFSNVMRLATGGKVDIKLSDTGGAPTLLLDGELNTEALIKVLEITHKGGLDAESLKKLDGSSLKAIEEFLARDLPDIKRVDIARILEVLKYRSRRFGAGSYNYDAKTAGAFRKDVEYASVTTYEALKNGLALSWLVNIEDRIKKFGKDSIKEYILAPNVQRQEVEIYLKATGLDRYITDIITSPDQTQTGIKPEYTVVRALENELDGLKLDEDVLVVAIPPDRHDEGCSLYGIGLELLAGADPERLKGMGLEHRAGKVYIYLPKMGRVSKEFEAERDRQKRVIEFIMKAA